MREGLIHAGGQFRSLARAGGGSAGGGAGLTPFGHRVVQQYRMIEAKAHAAVVDEVTALAAATAQPASDR
jgi:molybdate transport repressor ModE-like protein